MIQDFGLLLSVGVTVLVAVALTLPVAVLVRRDRRHGDRPARSQRAVEAVVRSVSSLRAPPCPSWSSGPRSTAGLAVEGGLAIETDPERWVDQDGRAVADLDELREGTGFSSELTILVEASTSPPRRRLDGALRRRAVGRHPAEARHEHGGHRHRCARHHARRRRHRRAAVGRAGRRGLVAGQRRPPPGKPGVPITPVSLGQRERLLDELEAELRDDLAPPPVSPPRRPAWP